MQILQLLTYFFSFYIRLNKLQVVTAREEIRESLSWKLFQCSLHFNKMSIMCIELLSCLVS